MRLPCHCTEIEATLFCQSAELLKATTAGRADRTDRYAQDPADFVVRRPRVFEELAEQRFALGWKSFEDGLHRLVALAVEQPVKGLDGRVIGPSLFVGFHPQVHPAPLGHKP